MGLLFIFHNEWRVHKATAHADRPCESTEVQKWSGITGNRLLGAYEH